MEDVHLSWQADADADADWKAGPPNSPAKTQVYNGTSSHKLAQNTGSNKQIPKEPGEIEGMRL